MAYGVQRNNGGPVGYGQPNRGMRQRLLRPEDEQFAGSSLDREELRYDPTIGNGQPPNVYPQQPQRAPEPQYGQYANQSMPGRTPMGENQYAQQAYQTRADNPFTAGIRNAMATPLDAGGVPPAWQSRNGGFNADRSQGLPTPAYPNFQHSPQPGDARLTVQPRGVSTGSGDFGRGARMPGVPAYVTPPRSLADAQRQWDEEYRNLPPGQYMNRQRPGTEGSVDPRQADPSSGYGPGGVNNPAYTGPGSPGWGQTGPQGGPQAQNDYAALQAAAQRSMAGFTDIQGMRDYFKPGQFMGQLEGFNTQGWGSGERGSDTMKNMFGTIASNFDVSQPGALRRALPEFQKAFPNATIVPHANEDLLDPDGPDGPMEPVDVIRAATAGGQGAGWQWSPVGGSQAPTGPQGPSTAVYNNAMSNSMTQGMPQSQNAQGGMPEVQDENSAMQFLEWLMQQQQGGMMPGVGR